MGASFAVLPFLFGAHPIPLENFIGVSIAGLDPNNPAGTDPGSDLDNQIRGTKGTIKYTFPNFTLSGQVDATQAHLSNPLLKTTAASDKGVFYASSTVAQTFDFPAFGRSLAGANSASTALTLLGADTKYVPQGTAITTNVSTSGTVQGGQLNVSSTAPQVVFIDTNWGNRTILHNDGVMGFVKSDGNWAAYSDNAGNFRAMGELQATDLVLTSDPLMKDDIREISPAAARAVTGMVKGYTYKLKSTGKLTSGVLSTEVAMAVPALVSKDAEGFDQVGYPGLIPYALVATNDAHERLNDHGLALSRNAADLTALRGEVELLRAELAALKATGNTEG